MEPSYQDFSNLTMGMEVAMAASQAINVVALRMLPGTIRPRLWTLSRRGKIRL
jgi:hypothetical protein